LKIWLERVFNNAMFEDFAGELLHEAEDRETPQYVWVSRAMPDLAHQLREQHQNTMNTISTHHQPILTENKQEHVAAGNSNRQEHILIRDIILHNLQPILSILIDLSNSGLIFHTQSSSDTRIRLMNSSYVVDITTEVSLFDPDPDLITSMNSFSQSFANEESSTAAAIAALNPIPELETRSDSIEQDRLAIHVKTVVELWKEYKTGIPHRTGAPAGSIQELDEKFGAKWQMRDDGRKAYSRRRHIWETIIQATENLNLSSDIITVNMDRWRENQGYILHCLNSALTDSRKHDSK
jgi:hypothetical protein